MTPTLRPARPADAETIAGWLGQERVRTQLSSNLRQGLSAALVRAGLRRRDQAWFVFAAEGHAVGLVALDHIDREDGIANLWYVLGDPGLARRGLTSAAIDALARLNPLGLATLSAWVGAPNLASARCLEKAGFRRIGTLPDAFRQDGARHDRLLFARTLDAA